MDSDIPNKSPGSNIEGQETKQLLFEDWDESSELPEAYHSGWSDLYSYAEEQHSNCQLSQPSTSSPGNELPAIAQPRGFEGNQNVDCPEQISRDFHQQEQHQSFQASAPSVPSPPSDLSAAMPDPLSGNENVDLLDLLNQNFHLQGQHQSFQASAPPDPSPPSDLPEAMSIDSLRGNQIPDHEYDGWVKQLSQDFPQKGQHQNFQASATPASAPPSHLPAAPLTDALGGNQNVPRNNNEKGQHESFQASVPLATSPPSDLSEAMSTDALKGNQNADWQEQVSRCFHQQGQHQSFQASAPPVPSPASDLSAATLTDVLGGNRIPDHEYDGWVKQLSQDFPQEGQHQNFQATATPASAPPSHLPAAPRTDALGGNEESDDWHVKLQDLWVSYYPAVPPNQSSQSPALSTRSDLPAIMVTDPLGENQPPVEPSVADIHLSNQPVQEQLQHQNLSTQTFRYLLHNPLPATMPDQTFLQNEFQTDGAAFAVTHGVLSPEAAADTAVAGAQQLYRGYNLQESHHQQLEPQESFLPFAHQQPHSLTAINVQLPFISTEAEIPTSRMSHGCQPPESNPGLTVTFEELDRLVKKYRVKKDQENLTVPKVTSLLSDRLGESIPDSWVSEFHNFDTFFKNLCRLRAVLLPWMANYEEIRSTTNLSRDEILDQQTAAASHPTVRYLDDIVFTQNPQPAPEQISMRNSNLLVDRPGCSSWKVTAHQESSVVSDMERNVVDPANHFNDKMSPRGKSFKTPPKNRPVPTSPASKNSYGGGFMVGYYDANRPASLRSPSQKLFREEKVRPEEMMPLQEMADFAEYFRNWRTERGLGRLKIHRMLMEICDRRRKGDIIRQLESFIKFLQFACKLKPILENWLNDIEVPESEPE